MDHPGKEQAPAPLVLIAESHPELQIQLSTQFREAHFSVHCFSQAEDLLEYISSAPGTQPTGMILDFHLTGTMSGLELTRLLREKPQTSRVPILMLSDTDNPESIVTALNSGADDYITKPFQFEVLLARLNACLRRSQGFSGEVKIRKSKLSLAGIDVDPTSHQVLCDGQTIHLTAFEYLLLVTLMSHPNEVLTREDLLLRVLGGRKTVSGRTIDVHIKALREKLGAKSKHIETIRGFGYRFTDS